MANEAKVGLVRCPKCKNLLPELDDIQFFRCGGCGALLQAKRKVQASGCFSEKSDDKRIGGISEKSKNLLEKATANLCNTSAWDVKSDVGSLNFDRRGLEGNGTVGSVFSYNDSKDATPDWLVESRIDQNDTGDGLSEGNGERRPHNGSTNGPRRSGKMLYQETGEMGGKDGYPKSMYGDFHCVRLSTSRYPDEGPSIYQ